MTTQPARDVFLQYLRAEGVRHVFGVPGGLLHPFFEAIEMAEDMELICSKHESGAAFMADGYARLAPGRLAVCASTAGPGATNLLTGVAVAFADGVPMLVVTGQPPRMAMGKGAAQEGTREDMDIVAMFGAVTKYSTMVTDPDQLGMHLRRALRRARSGRPGPVHLNLPVDLWHQPVDEEWFDPATYRTEPHTFDRRAVQSAARLLLEAAHPVILAGSGVRTADARQHLIALAELLPARVATSPRAKGLFPEDHPLSLGVLGTAGHEEARDTIFGEDVDVLLSAGAALDETTTLNWNPALRPSRALLQLDIDDDRIGQNYPVDVPLVGDAQTILVELVYHLHRLLREGTQGRSRWPRTEPARPPPPDPLDLPSSARGLHPAAWRAELNQILPHDAVIFSDIGGHMLFNIRELRVRAEQSFGLNLGYASMGHGTCAPIGAAVAHPDRTVLAIVGDGCFTMNGMDLLTAVEYDIPVIWLVENNNMHGITWHGSKSIGIGRALESVRLRKPLRIAAMAQSMGMHARTVAAPGELNEALRAALELRRPALIEILVDPEVAPPLVDRARSVGVVRDDE